MKNSEFLRQLGAHLYGKNFIDGNIIIKLDECVFILEKIEDVTEGQTQNSKKEESHSEEGERRKDVRSQSTPRQKKKTETNKKDDKGDTS